MKRSSGFTLIEVLITLVIVSSIIAFLVTGGMRFRNSLEYNFSVNQVLSDIKLTQQLAGTSSQICKIEFKPGTNHYTITKGSQLYRSGTAGGKIRFYGKSYFSFVPTGYTVVGGSGTLLIEGAPKAKKIIVSSKGRIRVE
ncbi:MAG: type II secretion system protein [bacterium]